MLAKLLVELMALGPGLLGNVEDAIAEMHSNDSSAKKAAMAAQTAATIATAAAKVLAAGS